IFACLSALRIFFADSPERSRGGKQSFHTILSTHAPERTGIWSAYRFTFVKNGGAAGDQRRINNVGVANHPAHIRGGPEHVTGLHIVHNFHAVTHGHGMATVITHNAFGLAGGTGGVEYIERVITPYRSAIGRLRPGNRL